MNSFSLCLCGAKYSNGSALHLPLPDEGRDPRSLSREDFRPRVEDFLEPPGTGAGLKEDSSPRPGQSGEGPGCLKEDSSWPEGSWSGILTSWRALGCGGGCLLKHWVKLARRDTVSFFLSRVVEGE